MQQLNVNDRSFRVDALPSEPALLVETVKLCHQDAVTFENLHELISKDPGLTGKMLQVAGSPAYRQWNETTDVKHILVVLGLSAVKQIVISSVVQQFFASFTGKFDLVVQRLWVRALICSNLAKLMAELVGYEKPEEAYLSGLLHQVGQLLLLLNEPKAYRSILQQYDQLENIRTLEQEQFGVDHCQLGAALIESWQLESFIADAVLFQHAPLAELENAPLLLKLLAVSSPLSSLQQDQLPQAGLERAGQLFNMTEATLVECLSIAQQQTRELLESLGYAGEPYLAGLQEQEEHRRQAEETLAGQIRDLTLSRLALNPETEKASELAADVRTSFRMLFGIDSLLLFEISEDQTRLTPVNDQQLKQLGEISLRLEDKSSQLVGHLNQRNLEPVTSSSGSIVDRQILRLLRTDKALVFPLANGGVLSGALILGLTIQQVAGLEGRLPLFCLLVEEIARTHRTLIAGRSTEVTISLSEMRRIAHEVSNPLTIIKNYLYILGKKIDKDRPVQDELEFIHEEIERVGNILLRAKDPENYQQHGERPLDLNQMLTSLDGVLEQSLYKTSGTRSSLHLDPDIPSLQLATEKLRQVLINLIKNAVEAMPKGGQLEISSRDHLYQNGREYVEISLQDNGPGIPRVVLENLFTPVASTKPGHSGLGLSIVGSLVNELDGQISCYSTPDKGTRFTLLIPRNTTADTTD